jgi:uncharacterized repeat protein (TIGR03803 family)
MADQAQSAASSFNINFRTATLALGLAIAFATTIAAVPAAPAQTFQVLHTFAGAGDGANPTSGLTLDRAGRFYGQTSDSLSGGGFGSIFKLGLSGSGWVLSPLLHFTGRSSGFEPSNLVFGPDGSLYGITYTGGQGNCSGGEGCGLVFKLQPPASACVSFICPWTETVLYRFTGENDGGNPNSEVVFDPAGNLYGVTQYGGTGSCQGLSCGVVYKLTPSGSGWTETVIHNFAGGNDGYWPASGLILDAAGNLYGTALEGGGGGNGVLYELSASNGWTETILHTFQQSDGCFPSGTLIADRSGNLYGLTFACGPYDGGTAYELSQPGNWTYKLLYSFPSQSEPEGSLVFDNAGNLYGTTYEGGAYNYGTAFNLTPSNGGWVETDLHDFSDTDGEYQNGSLVIDASGNLYGTANQGGDLAGACYIFGCGTVWEITP